MQRILSLLMAGTLAAALALGVGARDAGAQETSQPTTRLEIGYMPILPVAQLFVTLQKGWMKSAGITPRLVEFQNGPAMVQALLAGQLDAVYLGVGPAMVARARGADIRIVAANTVDQVSVLALGDLAPYFKSDPATAFARFRADHGRRAVITTFPVGSVPDTVLQYWLRKRLGIDPKSVEIVYQGTAQAQQALLTGAVDGAAILEPVVSTVLRRDPAARVVATGSALFPDQPGAVLAVRARVLRDHPAAVRALVAAHVRATRLLREDPAAAAPMVAHYVGGGRLDPAVVRAALIRVRAGFIADPHAIRAGTATLQTFQKTLGTLKKPVDLDKLFDTAIYDALAPRAAQTTP